MKINLIILTAMLSLIACTSDKSGPGNFDNAPKKSAAELNKIKSVELETRAANETDESNYYKATLFLTDYDKSKNQAVAVIDGYFKNGGSDYSPYVNEVCFAGDACGLTFTDIATLDDITIEQAIGEINRTGLKDAHDVDKSLYKNGSVLLIHSETRETEKSPVWSITVAVEIVDFKKNAKKVKLRYKVLQYKLKEYSA